MKKCAEVYKKGDIYYAHATSKTKAGFWVAGEPFFSFGISDDVQEHIMKALGGSKQDAETPSRGANLIEPLLRLAKVKSYSTFIKNAVSVAIELEEDELTFIPYVNEGAKDGFTPQNKKAVKVKIHEDVRNAFLEAFERAV